MEIETTTVRTATVLACDGRLNMVSAPKLRSAIQQTTDDGRSRLVIDLTGVPFVDSSGLGALLSGLRLTQQAGGDLRIASPGEQVRAVLTLSNLDRVLQPRPTLEDALDGW